MTIEKELYDEVVFCLETLYEGCDLDVANIEETSCGNSYVHDLLTGFIGRNVEDVRDTILNQLKAAGREL